MIRPTARPQPPQHVFPAWYCGEVRCERCRRTITEIDARGLPCVTDEHIVAAQHAGRVWASRRRAAP